MRKPFQGIWNIVRFNWHFYLLAAGSILFIIFLDHYLPASCTIFGIIICFVIAATTFISLLVSFFIYDLSGLYTLNWLNDLKVTDESILLNINAGFDETSVLLEQRYKNSQLIVLDFYDPIKHTEVSIKRARKAYPPFPNTKQINTGSLPLNDKTIDKIFVIFSAHEIRKDEERIIFFKELRRILKTDGSILVTEHLRDIPNFLAYNIGFFHFLSRSSWQKTVKHSGLNISKEIKLNPFITTFILDQNL